MELHINCLELHYTQLLNSTTDGDFSQHHMCIGVYVHTVCAYLYVHTCIECVGMCIIVSKGVCKCVVLFI